MNVATKFKSKTTKAKTEHPVFPDPNQELVEIADELCQWNRDKEILDAKIKGNETLLKEVVQKWFFKHFSGKKDVPSSVKVEGLIEPVLVQLTSRCHGVKVEAKNSDKLDAIEALLNKVYDKAVDENIKYEIDGNQIHEDNEAMFIEALSTVFKVFGHGAVDKDEQKMFVDSLNQTVELGGHDKSGGEMSEAITVAQSITPKASFHTDRHTLLSPEDNEKLQLLMPYVVSIKKKGVK
jgi:hypothetical protein